MQFVYEPIKTLIECCMADNREELWRLTDRLGVTPKLKSCVSSCCGLCACPSHTPQHAAFIGVGFVGLMELLWQRINCLLHNLLLMSVGCGLGRLTWSVLFLAGNTDGLCAVRCFDGETAQVLSPESR